MCRLSKKGCKGGRPCVRCISLGMGEECFFTPPKRRGRKCKQGISLENFAIYPSNTPKEPDQHTNTNTNTTPQASWTLPPSLSPQEFPSHPLIPFSNPFHPSSNPSQELRALGQPGALLGGHCSPPFPPPFTPLIGYAAGLPCLPHPHPCLIDPFEYPQFVSSGVSCVGVGVGVQDSLFPVYPQEDRDCGHCEDSVGRTLHHNEGTLFPCNGPSQTDPPYDIH
eukprot:TRINITY_DN1993_c0_g1_i3.p1 TRINITY_DN1993_c0_g1~~TRINITY_DN1993_c0_g1_i3.p1  ORF type:complete len:231 (-),score=36.15 TRINITY_DN1993_c0_g1_i3:153-821(-)